jgi:hypothetical protein
MEVTNVIDFVAEFVIGAPMVLLPILLYRMMTKPLSIKLVETVIWSLRVYPFLFVAALLWLHQADGTVPLWKPIALFVMAALGGWLASDGLRKMLDRAISRARNQIEE